KYRKPIMHVCIYRPPNTSIAAFLESFACFLFHASQESDRLFITGDLNIDLNCKGPYAQKLLQLCRQYRLIQLITQPTRITNKSQSLLDLIFVSNTLPISQSGCFTYTSSDHEVVYATVPTKIKKPPSSQNT